MTRITFVRLAFALVLVSASGASGRAQTVFPAAGATPTAIQGAADGFRIHLGTLNPNTPTSFESGRREVHWDEVPDADAAEGLLPHDYFNLPLAPLAGGILLSTPGIGFQVSAAPGNPAGTAPTFGNLNATYASAFQRFSGERLLTALGSNIVDVTFVVPGTNSPALVRAFGTVFSDVDTSDAATLEFFSGPESLGVFSVLPSGGGLSFLGIDFGDNVVSRVRIKAGQAAVGPNDLSNGGGSDVIVLDDFIYGEPVLAEADLGLSLQALPAVVSVGEPLVYAVTVTNDSSYDATDVVVTITTPRDTAIVEASSSCTHEEETVTCDLGIIRHGLGAIVSVTVTPTVDGELEAEAFVTSANDPNEDDNADTVVATSLPVCGDEHSFDNAACRMTLLAERVEGEVADVGFATKLVKQLRIAERSTLRAHTATNLGNTTRARATAKKAITALASFGRRISSRRAKRGIPPAPRLGIAATAAELKSMLENLRGI